MLDRISDQEAWRLVGRKCTRFKLFSIFKRFHDSFIVRRNFFEVRLWCNLRVIAQLLFDVIFYLLAIVNNLLKEGLLQALDLRELIFIMDYTTHHRDKLSELGDGLHFVQVEICVLDFLIDSTGL